VVVKCQFCKCTDTTFPEACEFSSQKPRLWVIIENRDLRGADLSHESPTSPSRSVRKANILTQPILQSKAGISQGPNNLLCAVHTINKQHGLSDLLLAHRELTFLWSIRLFKRLQIVLFCRNRSCGLSPKNSCLETSHRPLPLVPRPAPGLERPSPCSQVHPSNTSVS